MDFFERESRIAGSFVFLGKKLMAKNLKKYYLAWELRQQGKTFNEIGETMEIDKSWAASMVSFVNLKIKYQKQITCREQIFLFPTKYQYILANKIIRIIIICNTWFQNRRNQKMQNKQ